MQALISELTQVLCKENYTCIGPDEVQATGIKPYLFKPQETLWRVARNQEGRLVFNPEYAIEKQALIGVYPCDLRAMLIQDKIFLGQYQDPRYQKRREALFIVVINCITPPKPSCFCLSTGGSMYAQTGFDLAITAIDNDLSIEIGSNKGKRILDQLNIPIKIANTAPKINAKQNKQLPKKSIRDIPRAKLLQSKIWDNIAERCLGCAACTQACPTCFCHRQTSNTNEQTREWDSCFSEGHSFIHGAPLRKNKKERYQKWLTHKFADWQDQFETSGCVGCGRCIEWCPAAIDVVDELTKLSEELDET